MVTAGGSFERVPGRSSWYGDWYDDLLEDEEVRDEAVEEAKGALRKWFGEHGEEVFYQQQLEVIFERSFFHWVTRRALKELVGEGRLVLESVELAGSVPLHVFRTRSNRNWRRKAAALVELVKEFSPGTPLGSSLGQHGELMFDSAMGRFGFVEAARTVKVWNGREWKKTGHDLDRIYRRDGIAYGAEIKNTLKYMPGVEFAAKLEMCEFLGVKPLFITRAAPKTFNNEVIEAGGYALIFRYQLYPAGFSSMAKRVREQLYMTVDSPAAIADGTMQRFLNWHEKTR